MVTKITPTYSGSYNNNPELCNLALLDSNIVFPLTKLNSGVNFSHLDTINLLEVVTDVKFGHSFMKKQMVYSSSLAQ